MSGKSGFAVTIDAVDQASKKIDAINKKIASIRAPVERVQKSLSKFADLTGLNAIGRGMGSIAHYGLAAFQALGRIVAPLGAITGAASLAGMAALVTKWAEWGVKLDIASARIRGMNPGRLYDLQGAAALAGVSTGALTSGLSTLGDTLINAVAGRAPEAVAMMNTLGIAFRDSVTGQARNANEVLPELADKIAAIKDPSLQARAAVALLGGAGEEMLPFLRRGAAGIAEYTEIMRRYGTQSEEDTRRAWEMQEAQTKLSYAVSGLAHAIASDLEPLMAPLLTDMADWIGDNHDLIAQDVAGWAGDAAAGIRGIASAVGGVTGFFDKVDAKVKALTGDVVDLDAALKNSTKWIAAAALGPGALIALATSELAPALRRRLGGGAGAGPADPSIENAPYAPSTLAFGPPPGSVRAARESLIRRAPVSAQPAGQPGARSAATPALSGDVVERATKLVSGFEGYIPNAQWDVNHYRVGFGSDTVTDPATGQVSEVTANTTGISRAAAMADLNRRITREFMPKAASQVGAAPWAKLSPNTQAALTSIAYNYGRVPRDIQEAAQTGNAQAIAAAIEAHAADNRGVNAKRRYREAIVAQMADAPGGAGLTPEQQLSNRKFLTPDQIQGAPRGEYRLINGHYQLVSDLAPPVTIGGGTGTTPAVEHKVTGNAALKISIGGNVPPGTTSALTSTGNIWGPPPTVERAMTGPGG